MEPDSKAVANDHPEVLYQWSARKLHPIVLLYVAAVFGGFIVLSHFVLHSGTAAKTLAMAAVGSLVALVPAMLQKVEYRVIEKGLEKRPVGKGDAREFEIVFVWGELGHVVPMKHGFKFYKPLNESNPVRRFWKAHVSDAYSGEVHVGTADQARVLEILADHGISAR